MIPHRVESITHDITAWGMAAPTSTGLFGALPAAPNRISSIADSNVSKLFAEGRIPRSIDEIEGKHELIEQRAEQLSQVGDEVWINWWCGGAGYGDPLDRDPEMVAADVRKGVITKEQALASYGVILSEGADGVSADLGASEAERKNRRKAILDAS